MKAKQSKPKTTSPILDDQPARDDLLDFASYSRAFADLIQHPGTKTPITLGIFGRWGTGKTTLMRMLESQLRRGRATTVWFNAWQYSKEDELWAAFLQSILNQLQSILGPFQSIAFTTSLVFNRIDWKKVPKLIFEYLARFLASLLPILFASTVAQQVRTDLARDLLQIGGGLGASVLGLWVLVRPAIGAIRQTVSIDFTTFRKASDFEQHISFLDKFRDHFADIVKSLPLGEKGRIVVFIDDLDRCSSERAIQVLDAVQLFVDIPRCAYVFGLDVVVIQKAVAQKYPDDPVAQREYLGKIIQLPFYLPPLSRDQLKFFVESIDLSLPDSRCREVFIRGLTINPREVKRTINAYSLLWSMASQRPDLGGLITPVRLAIIVAIQHGFPELHRLLQEQPDLLSTLEEFYRNKDQNALAANALSLDTKALPGSERLKISGLAHELPSALQPYASSENLKQMLSMHSAKAPGEDDSSFINLSSDTIGAYFTLTRQVQSRDRGSQSNMISQLNDKYEVLAKLAQGAWTIAFLARDIRTDKRVVIKTPIPEIAVDPIFRTRLRREAEILQQLTHPNIVDFVDSGTYPSESVADVPYLVEEYLSGGSLWDMIDRSSGHRLSANRALGAILPILDGLGYVHRSGLVHRDLKPSNIIFDSSGTPKISDFGIAITALGRSELTRDGVIGTPAYMSPEQARGEPLDGRSDLYAIGCILYECVYGHIPFSAENATGIMLKHVMDPIPRPARVDSHVPARFEMIVEKLMAKRPDDRYASADLAKKDLLEVLSQSEATSR